VTCLAYKGETVVQGDTEGMLKIWFTTGVSCIATNNGPMKKILFSPMREKKLLLALHVDGVSLFDLNKVSASECLVGNSADLLRCFMDIYYVTIFEKKVFITYNLFFIIIYIRGPRRESFSQS